MRLKSFAITTLLSLGINSLAVLPTYAETLSWDIDNDGNTDALTDGLLFLRFSFELTGDSLTSGAISAGSNLSPSEVETKLNATQAIADIDGNGEVDALTDGILLLRYLFDVSGDSLIDGVISTNATRNTVSAINQYIQQYLPISRLSAKRGIGYGTGGGQQELSIQDLNLIDERMSWFYDWSTSSPESVRGIYPSMGIDFTPMLWGANSNEFSIRQYLDNIDIFLPFPIFYFLSMHLIYLNCLELLNICFVYSNSVQQHLSQLPMFQFYNHCLPPMN